ncbi:hypothetical protein SAMD00019534_037300 [Acytostelium subglobosum LB1]|uniref:hypothetical protein n=1 Tax=Acytostelium subglobosum LB1 TaxID=1410327 RepID=UPI0006448ADA|nr:hypothetical protein SAMD00019534_037300 [Acytostelium subglobosum LB1]GAM20555.1 hypothetical protein SAMD00019534_037300 [Acytostelium subglobosum LB1]|eukprot:XP_012760076.1 hypothetical protein SAMD00019534_037300 [Acytostelium subglobosum LB1]
MSLAAAQLDQASITTILNIHNQWRADPTSVGALAPATTIPALKWNATMARDIQTHVSKCSNTWSPAALKSQVSEWSFGIAPNFDAAQILNWIAEGAPAFDFTLKACPSGNYSCSMWAQAVWATSTQIGCGMAQCSGYYYLYCDYKTPGGYRNKNPYTPKNLPTPTPTSTPATTGSTVSTTSSTTSTTKPATTSSTTSTTSTTKPATTSSTTTSTTSTTRPATTSSTTTTTTPATTTSAGATSGTPTPTPNAGGSIDWRSFSTPVRNQGQCGDCYLFAAVANIEARAVIYKGANKDTFNLAEQDALNCISNGCNGGWPTSVYTTFAKNGIAYESTYPYTETQSTCTNDLSVARWKWAGYSENTGTTKAAFINALKTGPFAAALYVDDAFQNYKSGVFSCPQAYTSINHAITVTGYDAAGDYWIIKNSWDTWWGESGYIRLTASNDNCNMLKYAGSYVNY